MNDPVRLPEYNQFVTKDAIRVYQAWESGSINSTQCRLQLDDIGEPLTLGQLAAMRQEEADAMHCPNDPEPEQSGDICRIDERDCPL